MLYDQFGRKIPGTDGGAPPPAGIMFIPDPVADREVFDASRGLTPRDVDRIMTLANGGDVEGQCQLARELPEKNHDIAHALETRCNALLGCKWHITPGDDSPEARRTAETLEKELRGAGMLHPEIGVLEGCRGLLAVLCDGLLPGFAVAETIWKPGGAGFHGWRAIEPRFLSFNKSFSLRIRVNGNMSDGVPIPPGKAVYCRMGRPGADPVRGGLIRPLAWLHCFANLNLKDLLGFIERYGMPFVTAKIDKATYDKERTLLNNLICNFGPRGGGVFSRGVELELLQAANNTGDVYFKLLEYLGDAITKVILGQTASSGDSAGLSGGDAQSKVRQDILDSDARAIEEAINRDLVLPFMAYNYQLGTPTPRFELETAEPEDTAKLAETVKTLHDAGLQADPEEIGEKMGLKLTLRPEPTAPGGVNYLEMAERSDRSDKSDKSDRSDLAVDVYGKCAAGIAELAEIQDPAEFGRRLKQLAEDPRIDVDVFAAAVQRELMAGYLEGLKHSRIRRTRE